MNPRSFRNERGYALIATLLVLLLGGLMAAASTMFSIVELRSSNHYKTGTVAMSTAESGVVRVLGEINRKGVWNLQTQLSNGDWASVVEEWWTMEGDDGTSYYATIETDADDPVNKGWINVVAKASSGAARGVRVRFERDIVVGFGALVAANPNLQTFVQNGLGSASRPISGLDVNMDGTAAGTGVTRPAVSTTTDSVVDTVVAGIGANEEERYLGIGEIPSVYNAGGPSNTDITALVNAFIAPPNTPVTIPAGGSPIRSVGGNDCGPTLGDSNNPRITVFANHTSSSAEIRLSGSACGAGILIAYDPINITGTFRFDGLIIALGGIRSTTASGNPSVFGSVWTTSDQIMLNGNLQIRYSTQALNLAAGTLNNDVMPRQAKVTYWVEDPDLVASLVYGGS